MVPIEFVGDIQSHPQREAAGLEQRPGVVQASDEATKAHLLRQVVANQNDASALKHSMQVIHNPVDLCVREIAKHVQRDDYVI